MGIRQLPTVPGRAPRQERQETEQKLREMGKLSRKQQENDVLQAKLVELRQQMDKEKKARERDQEQERKTRMALERELTETKKTLRQQEEQRGEIQLFIVDCLCKSGPLKSG